MTTETTTNLPPCPLPDCEGGEHHYHDIEIYTNEEGHDCARAARIGYRCYSPHQPGLPEPVSLPEITDEMVERATSIFIGSSGYAAPGMRAALTGFRAELLAEGSRWQPIELDEIRAGMRIRATTAVWGGHFVTCSGVAHHTDKDGDWLTEGDLYLTSWANPTIYEVDSATIPADPDAEPVEIIAELLHAGDFQSLDMWGELTERERRVYRDRAREIVAVVRAHDEAVQA